MATNDGRTTSLIRYAKHKLTGYKAEDLDRSAGERWVTMSNALARAGHGLSLAEKRLVMIAVSRLDSRAALKPGQVPTSKITAAEYAEVAKCDMATAYQALQGAAKNLFNRKITMFEPAYRRKGKPLTLRTDMRWVGRCQYHEGEGWVELGWWPELLPAVTGLKKQFTSYQLKQASALRSAYSWRLLELLTRFGIKKSNGESAEYTIEDGWAEYTIEDFAASMDATEKQRKNFNNIKRRIIEPAVKELIAKDNWLIDWKPIKAGRKVKAIRFTFKRNPQEQLPF